MKLSNTQKGALITLMEDKSVAKDDNRFHNNTMNSLHKRDLVKLSNYANGEFWELTDKGINLNIN